VIGEAWKHDDDEASKFTHVSSEVSERIDEIVSAIGELPCLTIAGVRVHARALDWSIQYAASAKNLPIR